MATAGSKEAKQLEQIKNTFDKAYKEMGKASEADSNLATEGDSDIKYSLTDIENMSRKDYNKYGWVKVNNVLSDRELADFMSKVGVKKRQNNKWYLDLHNGKHMFAVGIDGVNNILIVSDGNFNNPSIERVYHIGLDNETDIENVRDGIYARENGNFALSSEIIQDYWRDEPVYVYGPSDFFSYEGVISEYEGKYGKRNLRKNKRLQNGKRSNSETTIKYSISEEVPGDGAFFSTTDNQGRQLTKEQKEYFKDSKVRDENGSLLALYHGSKNKFNEFTSDINWFSSSKEYSNNYGKEANLFNKVTKTEPKKSKVTFETHLNIKILIWPKMNLFLLKLNRRRLNPKAVLSTSVKLYAKGARLQGCSPEGFICLGAGRILALAFSQGTKYVLAKEKPWAAVLPNGDKKLALGEEARSGSPVVSESAYEGRTLELCILPSEKECIRREKP